jgi:hypothetical protein
MEGFSWHEHAALHHQLCEADAAQEGGLTPTVGAGDHHQRSIVTGHIVAYDSTLHVQT